MRDMGNSHQFADLHLHTNHSDGRYSPHAVIDRTVRLGLKAVAIVDHDDVSAFPTAFEYGQERGVEVISGVELSVGWQGYDLHVLGYCIDGTSADLIRYLDLFKSERISRARRIVEKLEGLGMPIAFEAVQAKAGHGTIGRPHIAQVLIEDGFVYSFQDAFDRFIGDGKPANAEKYKIDLEKALELLKSAGGLSVIAHPGLQLSADDVLKLVEAGVDGIEVIHPAHNEEQIGFYRELARDHDLLQTGGSDFHGGKKGESVLGKIKIPYEWVMRIKEQAQKLQGQWHGD